LWRVGHPYSNALPLIRLAALASLVLVMGSLVGCGSGSSSSSNTSATTPSTASPVSGTVTLSDPPTCGFPAGNFEHIYLTIRSVQANTSASAGDSSPGWQELAPQANTQPEQIDLLSLQPCSPVTLGDFSAIPSGEYQQIRLLLVANAGVSGPLPMTNACAGQGFNCVVLHDGTVHEIELSSDLNTGLKVPSGHIIGGPLLVDAGKQLGININFNSCASIMLEESGQYRLNPLLSASWEVADGLVPIVPGIGSNYIGINGQVTDANGGGLVAVGSTGAIFVALEQPDATGTDMILEETVADSSGKFNFCPLPEGMNFDIVVVATDSGGAAYGATAAANIPTRNTSPTIPGNSGLIVPVNEATTSPNTPTVFQGVIAASGGSGSIDAAVSVSQSINLPGIGVRTFTVPALGNSLSNFSVMSNAPCPGGAPANANCAGYTLTEPASNPSFGVFLQGTISYSAPASGVVPYAVRANAFVPFSGGVKSCSPTSQTVSVDGSNNPLRALPGMTVTVKEIDFAGCS
jgi:hypothetical protein